MVWSCPKAEVEGDEEKEEANTTFLIYPEILLSFFKRTLLNGICIFHITHSTPHARQREEGKTARAIRAERIEVAAVEGGSSR